MLRSRPLYRSLHKTAHENRKTRLSAGERERERRTHIHINSRMHMLSLCGDTVVMLKRDKSGEGLGGP
jgi:hypothetical protein